MLHSKGGRSAQITGTMQRALEPDAGTPHDVYSNPVSKSLPGSLAAEVWGVGSPRFTQISDIVADFAPLNAVDLS